MGSLLSGIGLAEGIILECKEGHRFHFLWPSLLLFYVCRQVSTAHDSVLRYNSSYPILGAFRALLTVKDGVYTWKTNPFAILDEVGPDLVESTVSMSRALGNNPQSTGKDVNLWKTLYMTVAFAAMK